MRQKSTQSYEYMKNFKHRFEIIYNEYTKGFEGTGAKPNLSAFARFLELPVSTVKSWEKRDVIPSAKDIKIIHDKLGFSYDWLIAGEGEIYDTATQKLAEQEAEIKRLRKQSVIEPALAKAAGQE